MMYSDLPDFEEPADSEIELDAFPEDDPAPAKRGRPEVLIDLRKLEALCQVHATDEEIAAHFGCSVKTIQRRKRSDADFAAVFDKGKADGKISLRRAQWQQALKGNGTMLVWLGKQVLLQRDSLDVSGPNGGPIPLENVRKMLDSISDEDLDQIAKDAGFDLKHEAA